MNPKKYSGLSLAFLLSLPVQGEPIVLEQFDYPVGPLDGADGGAGFDGPWAVTGWSRNFEVGITTFASGPGTTINAEGGLEFEGLESAGSALSRFGTAGQREASRILDAATQAALTADDSTIWFSILLSAPDNNRYGTMIFGTDILVAEQGSSENGNLSSADGQAFGVGFRSPAGVNGNLNAVAFVDSAVATVEDSGFLPFIDPDPAVDTHHEPVLAVGKINWKPDGTADEFFLFNITPGGQPEPSEEDAIATIEADFDQSNFTLISMQDTGSTIFDEIRFGTSYSDVAPLGTPDTPLLISDFTYAPDTGDVSLTWASIPGTTYIVSYTFDLNDWDNDIDDGVPAGDEASTSFSFNLGELELGDNDSLYFRVEAATAP